MVLNKSIIIETLHIMDNIRKFNRNSNSERQITIKYN